VELQSKAFITNRSLATFAVAPATSGISFFGALCTCCSHSLYHRVAIVAAGVDEIHAVLAPKKAGSAFCAGDLLAAVEFIGRECVAAREAELLVVGLGAFSAEMCIVLG
jgi:hypothetical protein